MSDMVLLEEIPEEIQRMYSIGPQVEAQVSTATFGGSFSFINLNGKMISVDAVELTGTGIMVREIRT